MSGSTSVRYWNAGRGAHFWRAQCPRCGWTSRDLPFPDRARADHALTLHAVLCKAATPGGYQTEVEEAVAAHESTLPRCGRCTHPPVDHEWSIGRCRCGGCLGYLL